MEQAARIKDDRIRLLEESRRRLQQNLDAVSKVLSLNPTAELVKAALHRKVQSRRDQIRYDPA